jgi:hypothetical protein
VVSVVVKNQSNFIFGCRGWRGPQTAQENFGKTIARKPRIIVELNKNVQLDSFVVTFFFFFFFAYRINHF